MYHLLYGSGEQQQQQQQQQAQAAAAPSQSPQPTSISAPPSRHLAWRDASDEGYLALPGEFVKKRRKVRLGESAADAEFAAQKKQRERSEDGVCHCALNIEGWIQCDAGFGHARHVIGRRTNANAQIGTHSVPTTTTSAARGDSKAVAASAAEALKFQPPSPYLEMAELLKEARCLSPSGLIPACRVHEIRDALPTRYGDVQWRVLFASDVDGFSVGSMYRKAENSGASGGACLLLAEVVATPPGGASPTTETVAPTVVGAFLSDLPTTQHSPTHFYGSPECFVFSFDDDHHLVGDEASANSNMMERETSSSFSSSIPRMQAQKQRGMIRVHRWSAEESNPEHFILSSPTVLGIGGGPDGAALFFHEGSFQRGTSSSKCASFNNCPELVGKAHGALRQSEFRVLRVFLFCLDDSDFVNYPDRREQVKFHKAFLAQQKKQGACQNTSNLSGSGRSDSFVGIDDNGNVEEDEDDEEGHHGKRAIFPCPSCKIQPRLHHRCSFLQ